MSQVNAQQECGTVNPETPLRVADEDRLITDYNLNKTLSVYLYFAASAYETYDFGMAAVEEDWAELNELFSPIGMKFELCSAVNMPNYNWDVLDGEENPETGLNTEDAVLAEFYTAQVINVYYVGEIINPDVAGYAYFPGGPDVIVMQKGAGLGTLSHEMGHFFGLYHTFETDNGMETVNGANCQAAGDLVCDTPADNDGIIDGDACKYEDPAADLNGDPYTPYLSNIMSYYGECRCKFTTGQYNRMAWMYLNERNYLR